MKVLHDICTIDVDYFSKPKKLPANVFKTTTAKTYKTFISALIIAEQPYNFLLAITNILDPIHVDVAKQYMKNPSRFTYFVEWFVRSRSLLESQLLMNYLNLGETTEGKAIIKILEKRFRNNFNDKTIELNLLKESGAMNPDTNITFTLG